MKKIWFLCLCLASLSLVGCFHIPDEDWLPSRNKVKTEDVEKENEEVEEAINSFVDWFNIISTQRSEMNENEITEEDKWAENIDESEEIITEEWNGNTEEIETEIDKNEEFETNSEKNDTWDNITD